MLSVGQKAVLSSYICYMSKKWIWILISIMTFAVVGIISLQLYWLKNAFSVKEDQFSQQVSHALSQISKEAEAQETIVEVSKEIFSLNSGFTNQIPFYQGYAVHPDFPDSIGEGMQVSKESIVIRNEQSIDSNTRITIFSGDTLLYNKTLTHAGNQRIRPDLGKELATKLNNKTLLVEKIVNKLLDYNEDITQRLSQATLQALITSEMKKNGISIPYEYVVKNSNGEIIYKSEHYKNEASGIYKAELFPNDLFSPPYYLSLNFPRRDTFLIKSLGFMGASSIILTLVIIFSYSLTLFVIFKQKRLSEIKTDFINNMTHELKTPISTISLASQMLKDKSIGEDQKNLDRISGIIDDESKRLGYQVEKVLQMAIFERGTFNLKKKETDLHTLIKNSIQNFQLQVQKAGGTLCTQFGAGQSQIRVDELHVSNVVLNLLENALKYCEGVPEIQLYTRNFSKGVEISVKDNGIGIRKEDQKRIFEKFYRVSTGNVHNVKGFGLGLSYVKKIVDAHGGTVHVESEPGKGSEFIIRIPYKTENDDI